MRNALLLSFVLALGCQTSAPPPEKLKIEALLTRELDKALASDREVIMSRVELPPNTTLPMHRHPGEEFAYLLDGSITVTIEGKTETLDTSGLNPFVGAIPFRAAHTATSGERGARLLVVRVHIKGQPARELVHADH